MRKDRSREKKLSAVLGGVLLLALASCGDLSLSATEKPVAAFGFRIEDPQFPLRVTFDARESKSMIGGKLTYNWNFGDGSKCDTECKGSAVYPHTYPSKARYSVVLSVTDENLAESEPIPHSVLAGNLRPVAALKGPARGFVGRRITFDGSDSMDADGSVRKWEFKFGDGSDPVSSPNSEVVHTFSRADDFEITLTVFDDFGETSVEPAKLFLRIDATDTIPPQVQLVKPANNTRVSGPVALWAVASDNVAIREVEFLANRSFIDSDDTEPYRINWDSTSVPNGVYDLQARALDTSGNDAFSTTVRVTVANP